MDGVELPEDLVALQLGVYATRLELIDHIRTNGPICGWTPCVNSRGAVLQHACEVSEAALQKAVETSGMARERDQHAIRRALRAAAGRRMPNQAGDTPDLT